VLNFGYASYGDLRASGDLLLASSGQLAESNNLSLRGNFGFVGAPCLDAPNGRGYLASGTNLRAFEISTGTLVGTLGLPGPVVDFSYSSSPTVIRGVRTGSR
jgi:hypothetical protein